MNNKNFQKNNIIFWIFGVVLLLIGVVQFSDFKGSPKTIDWAELKTMLKNREVERIVVINKERANIILTQEAYAKQKYAKLKELKIPVQGPHFYYNVSSPELFQTRLSEAQKDVPEDEQIY
ncbi:MAG: ATP-dependent metallopeptidase FtsH/Yme1/Tma family protein, partial [Bacteroidales bacterium]|nr:ATP-dependent metallopeptidase FtsH/Yme1/Tma family protein [Bacteroidales bacterium]